MRISDWSSDVCSSDLHKRKGAGIGDRPGIGQDFRPFGIRSAARAISAKRIDRLRRQADMPDHRNAAPGQKGDGLGHGLAAFQLHRRMRSEEHTSELQSLMRLSYAVFCLQKKNKT